MIGDPVKRSERLRRRDQTEIDEDWITIAVTLISVALVLAAAFLH